MSTLCTTLVTASCLLPSAGASPMYEASIAIADGTILDIGPSSRIMQEYHTENHIDLGQALLLPGLVNTHTHAAMTLFRGLADDLPLMQWLSEHIWPKEAKLTAHAAEVGAMLAFAEMIAGGITQFCDMYLFEERVARAADTVGIRAVLGEGLFLAPNPSYTAIEEGLAKAEALLSQYANNDRVTGAVMPHAIYTTSPELLESCRDMAAQYHTNIYIHAAETAQETAMCLETHGKRPIAYLNDLGLLTPHTVLVHCVDVTSEEIELLAERGVCVSHNPKSNLKLASGVAPIPAMLESGIPVGLGTDGAASNNKLDLFSEMNVCALLHKGVGADPTVTRATQVLDMATRAGAACLGQSTSGCLEKGNAADIIALDLSQPNLVPMTNPTSHAVYAADAGNVRFTMINGKVLYFDGSFTTMDYPLLLREVEELQASM
ncbi:amidohydrolase [Desulfovibrio inopinatus]|uniref:amidohydrolase n=1 Tax=Desulfovibrio inopinatus TaxID=102109 RepID=UPI000481920B|nr:amidohydrolase [Desulfovibrio inopinatus]